jgi:hypothetical protein
VRNRSSMRHFWLLLIAASVAPRMALSAPFCVEVTGIPLQCLYVDLNICQREAVRLGGSCAVNTAEFHTPPIATGQFCLLQSNGAASCFYPDRTSCNVEAQRHGGACAAAAPDGTAPAQVDPFHIIRPY